jgi:hypothetical protein
MQNGGTFGAASPVGDYNANFSIVGRVVLLHPGALRCSTAFGAVRRKLRAARGSGDGAICVHVRGEVESMVEF